MGEAREGCGIFQGDYLENIFMACQIKTLLVLKYVILAPFKTNAGYDDVM